MTRGEEADSSAERPSPCAASELRLMDGFEFRHAGARVKLCSGAQRLLAALAIRGELNRSVAACLLWPESTADRAHGSLRTTLWRSGHRCPAVVVERDRLSLSSSVEVDVHTFTAWTARLRDQNSVTDDDLAIPRAGNGELLPG